MRWLTEDPTLLLAAGIAIEAILAIILVRTGRGLVIGLMIAAFVLLLASVCVERLIVTEREEVEQTLDGVASALQANDVQRVTSYLAPAAARVRNEVESQLPTVKVVEAKVRDLSVAINRHTTPPTARATFRGILHVKDSRGRFPREHYLQRFTVDLEREATGWLITGYEARSLEESLPDRTRALSGQ